MDRVIAALKQARENIELLNSMPLSEWERETRVKANIAVASTVVKKWFEAKEKGHET